MRFARMLVLTLAVVAVMGMVAGANAQTRYVAVYFDNGLTTEQDVCPAAPPLTVADTIWVAMIDWDMNVSGVQFKIDYPPEMVWVGDSGQPPVTQGNTSTGFATAWGIPQNGFSPIIICQATFFWNCNGCTTTDIPVPVVGHPFLGGTIEATRWPDQAKFTGFGLTARVCATVPTEETTWGKVKSLYGE